MTSNVYMLLVLFLFLLPPTETTLVKSHSWSSDRVTDYNNWFSWNVENHKKRTALTELDQMIAKAKGSGTSVNKEIDVRLRKAELNKVSISVSQDGSGDFATITDALNSIPSRNTRRITLMIRPGVYR